jgi:hypothetical protein
LGFEMWEFLSLSYLFFFLRACLITFGTARDMYVS